MNCLIHLAILGEVLPSHVSVLWLPHPFRESVTERHECPAGWTLAEIVEDVCDGREGVRAWADGKRIDPEDWGHTTPARDVTLRYVPGPFLIPLIPIIAATIAASAIPAAGIVVAGVTISAAVAGAVISVAGALLSLGLSMLFRPSPPQLPQLNNKPASPTYSISGIGNQTNPYGVVPNILGKHRIFPPFAAKPFTELVGNDQFINALFCVGYGAPTLSQYKLGETPIGSFDNIFVNRHVLIPGNDLPPELSNSVDEEVFQLSLGTGEDPITTDARRTELGVDAISVDVVAPQGIYSVDARGNDISRRASYRIEYRAVGAGAWIVQTTINLRNNVRGEVVRKGYRWNVTRGQYEVRLVRLSNPDSSPIVQDELYWTTLRSHSFTQPVTFDSVVTLVSLRIRATDQLSGQVDDFNLVAQQVGWHFNGSSWVGDTEISLASDIFRTMMTDPANPKPIPVGNIDFTSLNLWAADCIAEGWRFNQVRDFEASFWDALTNVCAAGRAMPVVIDGKWGVIWERSTPPAVTQAFTPRNTLAFSGERLYETPPHGFRVIFINRLAGWQQDERIVYDDGYNDSNATLIEGLELPGVTDPDLVWRLGRFHIAQRRLRPEIYTIEVDIEQVAARRGDRVRVNHDVPMWGQGFGRVKSIVGPEVTLDEPVTMVDGQNYAIRFRSVSGDNNADIIRLVETVEGNDQRTVTLSGAGDLPSAGDIFMFGQPERESVVLRVLSVHPGQDFSARIALVDDAPEVLLADQGTIPDFNSQITSPVSARDFVATDLQVSERVVFEGDQTLAELRFSFRPPRISGIAWNEVQWRTGGETEWPRSMMVGADAHEATVRVPPGDWSLRVRSHLSRQIGGPGLVTSWAEIAYNADDAYEQPPNVSNPRIVASGSRATITWDTLGVFGVRGVEIRHSPLLTGATVSASRVLEPRAQGGAAQVPNLRGTYLLRWEGGFGSYSATPTFIVNSAADLGNFNVVEEIDEHPAFVGAATGLSVSGGMLILEGVGPGTYEFANSIDLGAVHPARLSLNAIAYGENTTESWWGEDETDPWFDEGPWFDIAPEDWDVELYYRATDDDPSGTPTWSEWKPIEIADISARAFEFRVVLSALRPEIRVVIEELGAVVDMPDRVIAVEDIVLNPAGSRIPFSPPYHSLQGVAVTIQDAPQGAYHAISGKAADGVNVQVFNSSGAGIVATVDVLAKGYGQVLA